MQASTNLPSVRPTDIMSVCFAFYLGALYRFFFVVFFRHLVCSVSSAGLFGYGSFYTRSMDPPLPGQYYEVFTEDASPKLESRFMLLTQS